MAIWFKCPHCGKGSVDEQGETLLDYEVGLYKCENCGGTMSSRDDSITYEEYKNMITEDYVSFEIAKLLKEKGFDDVCRAFWKDWYNEKTLCECSPFHCFYHCTNTTLTGKYNDEYEINIAAPTLQMAMKWLRETHNIFIDIAFRFSRNADNDINFSYYAEKYENYYGYGDGEFNSYEEACEAAIKYCLENLI